MHLLWGSGVNIDMKNELRIKDSMIYTQGMYLEYHVTNKIMSIRKKMPDIILG